MTVDRDWAAELLDKTVWATDISRSREYVATWLDTGRADDMTLSQHLSLLERAATGRSVAGWLRG